MAERRKHIDKAIRTKLKDYHEAAPAEVWEGVADHLAEEKRKVRVFWITRIAAAAVVVVMAGSAWLLMRNNEDRTLSQDERVTQEVITEQEQTEEQSDMQDEEVVQSDMHQEKVTRSDMQPAEVLKADMLQAEGLQALEQQADKQQAQPLLIASDLESGEPSAGQEPDAAIPLTASDIANVEAMYIAALDPGISKDKPGEILRENRIYSRVIPEEKDQSEGIVLIDETTDTEEASGSKWALGTQISPVYSYRDLGGSSSPGGLFARADAATAASNSTFNAVESGMMAYSGGINLNYQPGERLTIQSGLYYSRMGLAVDHAYLAPYFQNDMNLAETLKYQSISNSSGTIVTGGSPASPNSAVDYYTTNWAPGREAIDYSNQPVYGQLNNQINSGQVEQQFEYLEVPMILKYKMVDRRIGFNLLGGMTTNFLIGSDAYYVENSNRERIGETTDIKKVNYSSLVGVGMDYKLSERFQLNFEPFFKYYLNSINLSSAIKSRPYSIGIYTGISYLF